MISLVIFSNSQYVGHRISPNKRPGTYCFRGPNLS